MHRSPWGLHVFRETARSADARSLTDAVVHELGAGRVADALVRAGEIESALADAGSIEARTAMALTDALAAWLVGKPVCDRERIAELAGLLGSVGELRVAAPESFSYYALHPRDFADRVGGPPFDGLRRVAVVGLRSIGTTASAVICAAVRARGGIADRRTVRPSGDAYARTTSLTERDARWVRRQVALGSDVLVVDEGPGIRGSSILSAVDALVAADTPRERVWVLCTRAPDPATLLAPDGARRWRALKVAVVTRGRVATDGYAVLDPAGWRRRFLAPTAAWPGSWPWLERVKALSPDGRTMLKFEGIGRHGSEAVARAIAVCAAGFGPRVRALGDGLAAYEVLEGQAASARLLTASTLDRLAAYCAWRAIALPWNGSVDVEAVRAMARTNGAIALGREVDVQLAVERPVAADGHMMPHEWVEGRGGVLYKTDAAGHADDHLFPGPTDAAWDLAGAIVEWRMPRDAVEAFLARYAERSGDAEVRKRLPGWVLAYALHRLGWTEMAAASVGPGPERPRLEREASLRVRWLRVAAALGLLGDAGVALTRAV